MKTSSVEFISRSPNPLPMKSNYRRFSSGLHGNTAADSVRSEWPLWHAAKAKQSSRAGAANQNKNFWTLEQRKRRTREVREQALPSEYHRQTYL
ncbi:hypothetical protein TNCV_1379831 [Trichonephila clavipes]|nr:hypothetical protein TNCV_1379831 [Trichonephila clavipes]